MYPAIRWESETAGLRSNMSVGAGHGETLQEFSDSINTAINYFMYHDRNLLL